MLAREEGGQDIVLPTCCLVLLSCTLAMSWMVIVERGWGGGGGGGGGAGGEVAASGLPPPGAPPGHAPPPSPPATTPPLGPTRPPWRDLRYSEGLMSPSESSGEPNLGGMKGSTMNGLLTMCPSWLPPSPETSNNMTNNNTLDKINTNKN